MEESAEEAVGADSIKVVTEAYERANSRDAAGLLKIIDPHIELWLTEALPWGGHYNGLRGIAIFFRNMGNYIDFTSTPEEFVVSGEQVVTIGHTYGTVNATGVDFELRFVLYGRLRTAKSPPIKPTSTRRRCWNCCSGRKFRVNAIRQDTGLSTPERSA